MGKEPSCVINHEAIARNLRDNQMPSQKCSNCHWMINPAREIDSFIWSKIDREELKEILVSMDSIIAAFELDAQEPREDVQKVLQFLTD